MNLLYCGDAPSQEGIVLSALSLAKQTQQPLHIYILTMQYAGENRSFNALPQAFANRLQAVLRQKNSQSSVQLFDVTGAFEKEKPAANLDTRFTPYCMLRLYADGIDEIPERILYLDTDVICLKNPDAFYEQDFDGADLVGVLDYYGHWFFHQRWLRFDYMNSGVLLLNMQRIRETGLFENARRRCMNRKMFMPDQSALNKLAKKKFARRAYNEQRRWDPKKTVFLHFTTSFRFFPRFRMISVKPWQREAVHEVLGYAMLDSLYQEADTLKAKGLL